MPVGEGIYCDGGMSQSSLLRLDDVGEMERFLKGAEV